MGNCTILQMFENPRRGRQTRNFQQTFRKFQISNRLPNRYFPKIAFGCPCFVLICKLTWLQRICSLASQNQQQSEHMEYYFFTAIWPRILSTGMFPPHFKPCSLPLLYVVCLVLIFLERAFTLICPFRHRVTITQSSIHSIIFAWFTGITLGTFSLLAVNGIVGFTHWIVAGPIAVFQPDVC